jgi:hypothetical protein
VARRRRRDGPSGSLFPFLSVLACVIGTLTLSLAALALGQMGGRSLDQVRLADRFDELQAFLSSARVQLEELEEAVDEAVAFEQRDERLRKRLAGLGLAQDISLEELEAVAELRRELEELARSRRELERENRHLTAVIEEREEEIEERGVLQKSAPIVIDPSGLGRELRPYLVECSADHIEIHRTQGDWSFGIPEAEILLQTDFKVFLRRVRVIHNGIVIFLIREGGVDTYRLAAEAADRQAVRHAKLPIPGDGELDFSLLSQLHKKAEEP